LLLFPQAQSANSHPKIRQFIAKLFLPLMTGGMVWQIVNRKNQIFGMPRPDAVTVFLST